MTLRTAKKIRSVRMIVSTISRAAARTPPLAEGGAAGSVVGREVCSFTVARLYRRAPPADHARGPHGVVGGARAQKGRPHRRAAFLRPRAPYDAVRAFLIALP